MSNVLLALFLAAGAAAFVYAKVGRRVGYGNAQSVWSLVGITFVIVFIMMIILANTLISK